jgi:hypothetical protein
MRMPRGLSAALLVVAAGLPTIAIALAVPVPSAPARDDGEPSYQARRPGERPTAAECRTAVDGSRATAVCHNPNPGTDRIQLHIDCDRWWDLDVDARTVEVGPGQTVELADRCWAGIRQAWVSHRI